MTAKIFQRITMSVILANFSFLSIGHAEVVTEKQPAATDATQVKYIFSSVGSGQKFEESDLLTSRKLSTADMNVELKAVSYGLRKKAIFGLVPVRVYVLQLLAAHPEKLVKNETDFLASLKAAGPVQLHLTFLRDIPGQKISDSFKEGLEANKINTKKLSGELSQALQAVAAINEFKKTENFSITAVWKNNEAQLLLEDSQQIKVISGSTEFIQQIFSIWFGKPADAKLTDLKKVLLK